MIISKIHKKLSIKFVINILSNIGINENLHNLIKGIHEKPTANIILNGEILNAFRLDLKQGKDVFSHHAYSISYWKS